jgi:pteridine reductase
MELSGKVALVTGAARRLGRAIAITLAEGGADLVLHVHTSTGESLAGELRTLGRQVWLVRADLTRTEEVTRLSRESLGRAGRVDILVNNAAVFFPTPLALLSTPTWQTIMQTNLTAPFVLSVFLGRAMRVRGAGKIIQLSDWSGARPLSGYLPYCVSKAGLSALTRALAKAFAPQVQVNGIAPGPVLPPEHYTAAERRALIAHTPLRRLGQAADVARAVRFLAAAGDFVTGATYGIDGGWLARAPGGTDTSV